MLHIFVISKIYDKLMHVNRSIMYTYSFFSELGVKYLPADYCLLVTYDIYPRG